MARFALASGPLIGHVKSRKESVRDPCARQMWVVDRARPLVCLNGPLRTLLAGIANKAITCTFVGLLQTKFLNQAPLTKVFSQGGANLVAGNAVFDENWRDVNSARHLGASLATALHESESGIFRAMENVPVSADVGVFGGLGLSRWVLRKSVLNRGRRRIGI